MAASRKQWCEPIRAYWERKDVLTVGGLPEDADVRERLKSVEDPLELRRAVVNTRVPHAGRHAKLVNEVIADKGYRPYAAAHPALDYAIVHEVYRREGDTTVDDDKVRRHAADALSEVCPLLYEQRISRLFADVGITVSDADLNQRRKGMEAEGTPYDSTRFKASAFGLQSDTDARDYDKLFDAVPAVAKPVSEELPKLSPAERRSAIAVLRSIGVDPKHADDPDWARLALGIAHFKAGGEGLSERPLDLPEFDRAEDLGLVPEAIRTCADLYYIHTFDRAGAFDAVERLSARFVEDPDVDLGAAAPLLFTYMKRSGDRVAADARRKITQRLFEGGAGPDTSFEQLMVRLAETTTAFINAQTAGELLSASDRVPLSGRRLAVHRAIEDLERMLSRNGGGIVPFLAREAGTQLIEGFQILACEELHCVIGGDASTDILGVISQLNEHAGNEGSAMRPEQLRTLAVEGRRIMQILADDAETTGPLGDDELEELADRVAAWWAAFRWSEGGKGAESSQQRLGRGANDGQSAMNGAGSVIKLGR